MIYAHSPLLLFPLRSVLLGLCTAHCPRGRGRGGDTTSLVSGGSEEEKLDCARTSSQNCTDTEQRQGLRECRGLMRHILMGRLALWDMPAVSPRCMRPKFIWGVQPSERAGGNAHMTSALGAGGSSSKVDISTDKSHERRVS